MKEAISVRQKAANLPQTMAAFIGATGRIDREAEHKESTHEFLVDLARSCHQSGIPQEEAIRYCITHFRGKIRELLIRETFRNIYDIEKHFGKKPCFPKTQTLALQIDDSLPPPP